MIIISSFLPHTAIVFPDLVFDPSFEFNLSRTGREGDPATSPSIWYVIPFGLLLVLVIILTIYFTSKRGHTKPGVDLQDSVDFSKKLPGWVFGYVVTSSIVLLFLTTIGLEQRYNFSRWVNMMAVSLTALVTLFIGIIIYVEEYHKPQQPVVKVQPVPADDLDEDEDFAFLVENLTARRISGGVRLAVLPRNLTLDGEEINLHRYPIPHIRQFFLSGNQEILEGELRSNCPMYCQFPAAIEEKEWRGWWATYLDPAGGDVKKKISTSPFPVYHQQVAQIKQSVISETNQSQFNRRLEILKEKYRAEIKETSGESIEPPNELIGFIFPTINIDKAETLEVELKNIDGKFSFERRADSEWVLA